MVSLTQPAISAVSSFVDALVQASLCSYGFCKVMSQIVCLLLGCLYLQMFCKLADESASVYTFDPWNEKALSSVDS